MGNFMMKFLKDDSTIKEYIAIFKKIFVEHDKDKDNHLDEKEWRSYFRAVCH